MKKGILVAVLALFTGVALVGCSQKAEENKTDDSTSTVATQESEGTQEQNGEESTEAKTDEQTPTTDENGENTQEQQPVESMDLGEPTVQGESIEGNVYNGKYRLTNGSDRVVVEWSEESCTNKTEYVFSGDKLSSITYERTYADEERAKSEYEAATKQGEGAGKAKNLSLEGSTIKYTFEESEWEEIKDYTKQQIFDEQKAVFEELNKSDNGGNTEE